MFEIKVKICGVKPGDNLRFTHLTQVSHVGFIFVKASKRLVQPEEAKILVQNLHSSCIPVGVFQNENPATIIQTCQTANISTVQLHGQESVEDCKRLRANGLKVWKGIPVPVDETEKTAIVRQARGFAHHVDAVLLDSSIRNNGPDSQSNGGSGIRFSWQLLGGEDGLIQLLDGMNVFVAGGITPDTVKELLTICHPFGIDVSSGVEENGRKSAMQIEELVKVVSEHGANDDYTR